MQDILCLRSIFMGHCLQVLGNNYFPIFLVNINWDESLHNCIQALGVGAVTAGRTVSSALD